MREPRSDGVRMSIQDEQSARALAPDEPPRAREPRVVRPVRERVEPLPRSLDQAVADDHPARAGRGADPGGGGPAAPGPGDAGAGGPGWGAGAGQRRGQLVPATEEPGALPGRGARAGAAAGGRAGAPGPGPEPAAAGGAGT